MGRLVVATTNRGKVREIASLLSGTDIELLSLSDFPSLPPLAEEGNTFEDNAKSKALQAAGYTGLACIADDSGIEVDFLGGAPGVYSARFSGPGATDASNNAKLIGLLRHVPAEKRTARFRAVVVLAVPGRVVDVSEGVLEGIVLELPRGSGGFGYDPLLYIPALGKTVAELSLEEKNEISHRAQALKGLLPSIMQLLGAGKL
ncbi:MAG: XTP/dITP diphosphatase [Bacillota bacterium]